MSIRDVPIIRVKAGALQVVFFDDRLVFRGGPRFLGHHHGRARDRQRVCAALSTTCSAKFSRKSHTYTYVSSAGQPLAYDR